MKKIFGILLLGVLFLSACSQTKSAKELHKDGVDCFYNGNFIEAEEYLAQAVAMNPDKAEYYIDYGMALIRTGKYDEAIIQFDKAILDKDNKIVRENNKRAQLGRGIAYFESAQYGAAISEFDKAYKNIELDKLNLDILYYKGEAEEKFGNYEEAKETYEELMEIDSSNAVIYSKLGLIYEQLKEVDKALDNYEIALSKDKNNYELYFGKYFLLVSQGQEEEAKQVLDKAMSIKAKSDEDKYHLGRLYYYRGEYDLAEQELKTASEKGFNQAYYYLGEIQLKNKKYKEAIPLYEAYIENETFVKSAAVYNQLGFCYIKRKNYDKALEYIEKGIALNDDSKMYNLLFNEITVYEYLFDYDTALLKAEEFLASYPKDKKVVREKEFIMTRLNEKAKEKNG